jgi:hypothetical protein
MLATQVLAYQLTKMVIFQIFYCRLQYTPVLNDFKVKFKNKTYHTRNTSKIQKEIHRKKKTPKLVLRAQTFNQVNMSSTLCVYLITSSSKSTTFKIVENWGILKMTVKYLKNYHLCKLISQYLCGISFWIFEVLRVWYVLFLNFFLFCKSLYSVNKRLPRVPKDKQKMDNSEKLAL